MTEGVVLISHNQAALMKKMMMKVTEEQLRCSWLLLQTQLVFIVVTSLMFQENKLYFELESLWSFTA